MDTDDKYMINLNCIVTDYVNYKLKREGFHWQTSPCAASTPAENEVLNMARDVCTEFERRYEEEFSDMCVQLAPQLQHLDHDSYVDVLNHLLVDGINWGRVAGILTFTGAVAVLCMKKKQENKVDLLVHWSCSFMQTKVEKWISNNGGWKGFVDHFQKKYKASEPLSRSWGKVFFKAIGAVAIETVISGKSLILP